MTSPEEVWEERKKQQRESEDHAEESWDKVERLRTSQEYKMAYEGNFENIPIPVKDAPAGKRIDEAVVKALGWHINRWEDETDGGWEVLDAQDKWMGPWSQGNHPKDRWSPSTDIKAAWELVEAVEVNKDFYVTKVFYQGKQSWEAFFRLPNTEWIGIGAETAPLAITRAFLLSRGVQEI